MYHGIDLSLVSAAESGLTEERSYGHKDSGGPDLEKVLRELPISRSDAALDFGCGKGGAMLTFAKFPFQQVDGVELSPQLAQVARNNLRRMRVSNSTVFSSDAAQLTDLDPYTYFYMFNPFPEIVMRSVLENISCSLRTSNRSITLIYKNPVFHDLVIDSGFRQAGEIRPSYSSHPFRTYVR